MGTKIVPICADCGSREVRRDAYAVWNAEKQDWELHSVYDEWLCDGFEGCGNACGVEWVPFNDKRNGD